MSTNDSDISITTLPKPLYRMRPLPEYADQGVK